MPRPRLIDLFCGAGGAAVGYHRAGFDVVGVDNRPQPRYPFEFHQADALEFPLDGFDVVHASPPCQRYCGWQKLNAERWGFQNRHPDLLATMRERLAGRVHVIENVPGAPLVWPVILCGSMFGLGVVRHRGFESPVSLTRPMACRHTRTEIGVYGTLNGRRLCTRQDGSIYRCAKTLPQAQAAMGIDWMEWDELKESIPPAYTEWIGRQLLAALTKQPHRPEPTGPGNTRQEPLT